ncbi:hypothetical protein [Streptomyces atriruber]|uniref:hypothetical protein n=1 Tax=Streptomyces atriruber TaxID=545121 RepID=UPI0006E21941|nr:hypothetical protein [Streptomyces atriruber]
MTVRELLERIDSRELAEWAAYERYAGPVDDSYLAGVLAALHEQVQTLNRMTGAAHFTDKKHKKNPAPEPSHYPRPHELYERDASSVEEGDDN